MSGLCFKNRIFWRKNDGAFNSPACMGSNRSKFTNKSAKLVQLSNLLHESMGWRMLVRWALTSLAIPSPKGLPGCKSRAARPFALCWVPQPTRRKKQRHLGSFSLHRNICYNGMHCKKMCSAHALHIQVQKLKGERDSVIQDAGVFFQSFVASPQRLQ